MSIEYSYLAVIKKYNLHQYLMKDIIKGITVTTLYFIAAVYVFYWYRSLKLLGLQLAKVFCQKRSACFTSRLTMTKAKLSALLVSTWQALSCCYIYDSVVDLHFLSGH